MKKKKTVNVIVMLLAIAALEVLSYGFIKWIVPVYALSVALLAASLFVLSTGLFSAPKKVLKSVILTAVLVGITVGLVAVLNIAIFKSAEPVYAVGIVIPLVGTVIAVLSSKATGSKIIAPVTAVLLSLIIALVPMLPKFKDMYIDSYDGKAADPAGLSESPNKRIQFVENADIYVSADGSDDGDGSFYSPFATLEKAREQVRNISREGKDGIIVAVKGGRYSVSDFTLTAEDSGTESCPVTYCIYGNNQVILSNAFPLDGRETEVAADSNVYARFPDTVKDSLVCYDISSFGLSSESLSKQRLIGSFNTAEGYGINVTGETPVELFCNGNRQSVARYPDTGYTGIGTVLAANENGHDSYTLSEELNGRMSSWKSTEGALIYGFFQSDWADSTTDILSYSKDTGELTTQYYSAFGCIDDAPCFVYNVPEELDAPGEWYMDTENMLIYYLPEDDDEQTPELNASYESIINIDGAEHITLKGFTLSGTCSDAISIKGSNITVSGCHIENIGGNAIAAEGYNNTVTGCSITATGKGGIILDGGDRETLTYGNNKADNNHIYHWADVFRTYSPAVTLKGVGNVCSHNEICYTDHEAITFAGNCHTIEYNNIHDVCLQSNDAGAIYSGLHWDWYGTTIRYNCIYNLGSEGHSPAGIYLDDALSGITVYGNLLVNVPRTGIQIGGGRDNDIRNNIIINTNRKAIDYDQRAIDAFHGGWFVAFTDRNQQSWQGLINSPYKSELWQKTFPQMASFSDDENNQDNPGFIPNPAGSTVTENVIVNLTGETGTFGEKVLQYSTVSNNPSYKFKDAENLFTDYANGDYTIPDDSAIFKDIPEFENIPISEIGMY